MISIDEAIWFSENVNIVYFHYNIDDVKCPHFPSKNYFRIKYFEELDNNKPTNIFDIKFLKWLTKYIMKEIISAD